MRQFGELVVPDLESALEDDLSPEATLRVQNLLVEITRADCGPDANQRQALRAVERLERVGTPEAKGLLKRLAGGYPSATLIREAKKALARCAGSRPAWTGRRTIDAN